MNISIPLSSNAAAGPLSPQVRIGLPVSLGGTPGTLGAGARETQVLRAVAAAAASANLKGTLEVLKTAKDTPADVIGGVDRAAVEPVLIQVTSVQQDRKKGGTADERTAAIARAIGADPQLAAAAREQIKAADGVLAKTCAYWVATVDAALLERAAAAARAQEISAVPSPETQIARIEASIKKFREEDLPALIDQRLQQAADAIGAQLTNTLAGALTALQTGIEARVSSLGTELGSRIDAVATDLSQLADRVSVLERPRR